MSNPDPEKGYDIAGDIASSNMNLDDEQNSKIIKFNVLEEQVYLGFKIFGFIIAMGWACYFLKIGLDVSRDSLMHIVHHQTVQKKQVVKVKAINASEKEKPDVKKADVKKEESESMGYQMLHSGSIITLVAFILGTGLTLLLTIIKFSFNSRQQNEDNSNIALAGPASELFMAMANYIKSKIK